MPRTGKVERRKTSPDPLYQNLLVAKLINKVLKQGKKTIAQTIVYESFNNIRAGGKDPLQTFEKAVENATPKMEVRPRRVGGASYMVPMEVRGPRRQALALNWLITAARNRQLPEVKDRPKNKPVMITKLSQEILDAANGEGGAVSKKAEMHRMAEANKAFAHFRW
ncbi:30S ribosomal protein S7 [Candidatus Curtissbacteria bacterium RIFCSPLOWO2_01_FULL_39_62]|uniref:Small ribosomal subunit protein uS7 n=1 Tax=Candidatus Curtissbacteria bacterium RIFCSPHIGHO2_02_FULL_40_16b TaxID=1797714 RepID=A0A1F5G7L9_9BACT|nr:MAG: 30S ribosomal protein S7 [Candidatus Curtissbacteria bacterium RIFCSPHIGHO2_01_FULL_39_57]OGD87839.1 MAG: 30S ribosomal protein S7 [Candidatus Curtissbacteria bacterium RIFCSPHIGHO2_02_FULL_40_16b]OGD90413.1 MAG: 30S ribosomal protein S7 [Candidatus Curtissbacteria bacterium RIFCSPHIGHO2_12_FULL_38_37]OGD99791.1 MAG: 30S ribosomal protein S7 [Candidatus Curtissbacteria bacterium RIFCSPLOWO2_02_FULL_40_11]OGE00846.1 MAG: 30S ribosomal protein S7 [Candidatus Curtissbacteria bacterium RIFC